VNLAAHSIGSLPASAGSLPAALGSVAILDKAGAARLLGAEFHNQAWSGIGIYKGYAGVTMRQAYTQTLQTLTTRVWDFRDCEPDVVVIQLGDNDVYTGATHAQISQALMDFVTKDLRPRYPHAHVVLAATMGWDFNEVANDIDEVAGQLVSSGDHNVSSVKLPWFSGQEHRVCCEQVSHARIVAGHISDVLGWEVNISLPEYAIGCLPDPVKADREVTLKNPGFESPLTVPAGNAVADGWRSFAGSGGGTAAVMTDGGAAGAHYLRLTAKRTGYVGLYQAVEHAPHVAAAGKGLYFRATAQIRGAAGRSGTAKLKIEFRNQTQNLISQVDGLQSVSGGWSLYETTAGPAPAGTWHVRVVLVADTGSAVDFDEVTLEVSSTPFR